MNHPRRGKCIIFKHDDFSEHPDCKNTYDIDDDCQSLERTFSNLRFDLEIHKDLRYDEIMAVLKKGWCISYFEYKALFINYIFECISAWHIGSPNSLFVILWRI